MRVAGHRGFILYESASFMRARPDGTFEILYRDIPDAIVPWVRRANGGRTGPADGGVQ